MTERYAPARPLATTLIPYRRRGVSLATIFFLVTLGVSLYLLASGMARKGSPDPRLLSPRELCIIILPPLALCLVAAYRRNSQVWKRFDMRFGGKGNRRGKLTIELGAAMGAYHIRVYDLEWWHLHWWLRICLDPLYGAEVLVSVPESVRLEELIEHAHVILQGYGTLIVPEADQYEEDTEEAAPPLRTATAR